LSGLATGQNSRRQFDHDSISFNGRTKLGN
jgi:hypothetical protein